MFVKFLPDSIVKLTKVYFQTLEAIALRKSCRDKAQRGKRRPSTDSYPKPQTPNPTPYTPSPPPPLLQRRWWGILSVLVLASTSCTRSEETPQTSAAVPSNFKVAMVLPSTIDDGSWSQSAYEGLQLIEEELNAAIAYTEEAGELPETRKKEIFANYAKEGFDFIIGHGGEFLEAVEVTASEFPRSKFSVTTSCSGNNVNLGCLSFRGEELGYLAGVVAALKSQSNKVAFIGGVDYPHMKDRATLFERGATSINPDIEVAIEWVGSWTDRDKVREIAKRLHESGVDVISVSAEPAEEAIFPMAEKKGFDLITWQLDRHASAPDRVITSAIQNIPQLMLQGAVLVQTGRWEGKQYKLGITEGVQELAPFRGMLNPQEERQVKAITEDILTDTIDTTP